MFKSEWEMWLLRFSYCIEFIIWMNTEYHTVQCVIKCFIEAINNEQRQWTIYEIMNEPINLSIICSMIERMGMCAIIGGGRGVLPPPLPSRCMRLWSNRPGETSRAERSFIFEAISSLSWLDSDKPSFCRHTTPIWLSRVEDSCMLQFPISIELLHVVDEGLPGP